MFAFSSSTHLPSDTPHFLPFFPFKNPTLGSPVAPIGAYKQVESYGNSWVQNIESLEVFDNSFGLCRSGKPVSNEGRKTGPLKDIEVLRNHQWQNDSKTPFCIESIESTYEIITKTHT